MLVAYLASVALALFVLVVLTRVRASGDDPGAEGGQGWGDGGVPTPPRGPTDPDDGAAWWPEFERQFAEWVERTQRAEAGVGTRGSG
jgi:hypothetical protein